MAATAVACVVGYFIFSLVPNNTDVAAVTEEPGVNITSSRFTFSGVNDWRQGPTNKTSMVLFYGHDCFVLAKYDAGSIDIDAALEKHRDNLTSTGYNISLLATRSIDVDVSGKVKQFELNQYDAGGNGGAGKIKEGQELGYLQLSDGYIEIEGYCDTADQLPSTISAIEAIRFN